MDPNATLEELRALAVLVLTDTDLSEDERSDAAVELAEKFSDLDEWLTRQGFLPQRWSKHDRL